MIPTLNKTQSVAQEFGSADSEIFNFNNNNKKEINMADVDTIQLSQEHADIRRENAVGFGDTRYNIAERSGDIRREIALSTDELNDSVRVEGGRMRELSAAQTSEIIKEGLKGNHEVFSAVRDNRYDLSSRIENNGDRLERAVTDMRGNVADRFFAIGRDVAELRAGQVAAMKDVELNALKTQIEAQKNTQFLSEKIGADGDRTRALINDLKYHDLNRGLVERNAELVELAAERRHWRHLADQNQFAGQWAAVQSQLQAFNSQLQDTRQGMVNFGSMAGTTQASTSNAVR